MIERNRCANIISCLIIIQPYLITIGVTQFMRELGVFGRAKPAQTPPSSSNYANPLLITVYMNDLAALLTPLTAWQLIVLTYWERYSDLSPKPVEISNSRKP